MVRCARLTSALAVVSVALSLPTWTSALAAPSVPDAPSSEASAPPDFAPYVPLDAPTPTLPPRPRSAPADLPLRYELQLRLHNGLEPPGSNDPRLAALESLIRRLGLRLEPLVDRDDDRFDALLSRAAARTGREPADLRLMFRAVPIADPSPSELETMARALHRLDVTEWVFIDWVGIPPPVDLPPTTDDYRGRQGYDGSAGYASADPGIDAVYAHGLGFDGSGLRIYDCEYGWDVDHEDLAPQGIIREPGQTEASWIAEQGWNDHGTAVVGIYGGANNAYGVTGMAYGAEFHVYSEFTVEEGSRRVTAIANAIADARVGDIVVLEMQTGGANGDFAPAEYSMGVWQAVRVGTDAGVVVVAAAGNGNEDLDSPGYADYRARGDSGSIIVGAGSDDTDHSKLYFSTYGSRVDLQGWGTGVTTAGYGSLARFGGDEHQEYTGSFNGTSSATPVVTSAVALLQHYARDTYGSVLPPSELRDILIATGIPQSNPNQPIGPFPDVRAAFAELDRRAPEVGALDLSPGREGDTLQLTATATSGANRPLSFQWTVGAEARPGRVVELTLRDDGDLPVTLTVADSMPLSVEVRSTLTVENVPPTLEARDVPPAVEGQTWQVPLTVFDPGDDTVTLAIEESTASAVALVDGALSWNPTLADVDDGAVTVLVSASDEDGGRAEIEITAPITFLDIDQDGLPDSWEVARGFDPTDPTDADSDSDGDGRSLRLEFELGTDPNAFDGPSAPTVVAPTGGLVARPRLVVRGIETATTCEVCTITFEWRSSSGTWRQSPALPAPAGAAGWSYEPDAGLVENTMTEWRAFLSDPYVDGPSSPTASFFFSAENEPPPPPTVSPVQLGLGRGRFVAEAQVTDVGIDPEGTPVHVEVEVRHQGAVLSRVEANAVTDGVATTSISLTHARPGLTWTARAIDADGRASAWAEPAPLRMPPEEGGCRGVTIRPGPPSGLGVLFVLASLGLRRRPRRRHDPSASTAP